MKNNLENQDIKTDKPLAMSYEALKADRDALAVENAALKDAIPRLKNIDYSNDSMDDVSLAEDIGFNTAVTQINNMVIETPATDAALAAIEARGVEMATVKMQESGAQTFGDCYIALVQFANELREGK